MVNARLAAFDHGRPVRSTSTGAASRIRMTRRIPLSWATVAIAIVAAAILVANGRAKGGATKQLRDESLPRTAINQQISKWVRFGIVSGHVVAQRRMASNIAMG